ncbi:MAG: BatA domain-containing protein [Planctomycetes bacterium]|nr:BatA domain-containing protein [Planctomycetota bacterium]
MMSFFLNPWVMAAGVALAVSPIIIHLINRMRFRRIQWAAMEFLLKAQKKMRRKKILEQLLLLLLRILLVLLAGLLFARFLGSDPSQNKETRPVLHVIVLDDTPSMTDTGSAVGGKDAFTRARSLITDKLLPSVAKASTPQTLRLIRLSDQGDMLNPSANPDKAPDTISLTTIESVKGLLASEKTAPIHVGIVPGLKKAKELLAKSPGTETAKVVHIVSDMRSADWTRDTEAITLAVQELTDEGVKVHLIDVAAPNRTSDPRPPAYSENVGIVELKPRNRVTAFDKEVEFDLRVRNYGVASLKDVRAEIYVNGAANHFVSVRFDTLPGGQDATLTFAVTFNASQGATMATKEDPLAKFNVITAILDNTGADAIAADNVRHAVVEVREKLSVLLVTRPPDDDKPTNKDGDSFALRLLFEETKLSGTNVVSGTADSLDKLDLHEFSSIYIVNIPQLSKSQVGNLERYANEGGGVGIFLGPNVTVEQYNNLLYRAGTGIMPFPLPAEPTPELTKEQKLKRGILSGAGLSQRVLLRDRTARTHPALRGIYETKAGSDKDTAQKVEASFTLVEIERHWPIARIGKWREDRSLQELYCLPNEQSISEFEARVKKLNDAIKSKYGEPKFEKYRSTIDSILDKCRSLAADPENPMLSELARQLDKLLSDQINEGDASEALLREFWSQPEMAEAKALAQSIRDSSRYGDPLYVARTFGNGRVAVFTIPVGAPWSTWPSGLGLSGWVAVMTELQKYLSSGSSEDNRTLGAKLEASYELGRYKPEANWSFLTYDAATVEKGVQKLPPIRDPMPGQTAKAIPLESTDTGMKLNFADTKRPGAYFFTLTWQKRDGDPLTAPATKPEYLATAFNFDTELEGDLKRLNTSDFSRVARGAEEIHSLEDDSWLGVLEQKPTDMSSGRWIYLLILLVLIFEQAMAVRLSYHHKADELETFAPSAAAAMAGRTTVQTAEAEVATTNESV